MDTKIQRGRKATHSVYPVWAFLPQGRCVIRETCHPIFAGTHPPSPGLFSSLIATFHQVLPAKMDNTTSAPALDRPASPAEVDSGLLGNDAAKSVSMSRTGPKSEIQRSPRLPANPPPTPDILVDRTVPSDQSSVQVKVDVASPLSPPPSPPSTPLEPRSSRQFCFSESLIHCKRQAASIHGKWSDRLHVAHVTEA